MVIFEVVASTPSKFVLLKFERGRQAYGRQRSKWHTPASAVAACTLWGAMFNFLSLEQNIVRANHCMRTQMDKSVSVCNACEHRVIILRRFPCPTPRYGFTYVRSPSAPHGLPSLPTASIMCSDWPDITTFKISDTLKYSHLNYNFFHRVTSTSCI